MKHSFFVENLNFWYQKNHRDLPWRKTKSPYLIWLSEIILQQTRVAQGLPYFYKFSEAFPTIIHFADASESEVLRLWQGLGYYSRARNMHNAAIYIKNELDGEFPINYRNLLMLKGVGTYTAAAIASFAYDEPVAVLDGNVFRVLSRYFGLATDISSPKGKNEFTKLANSILPIHNSAAYNQAIMEFGALQCTPYPNCETCPINTECFAFAYKKQKELPVKLKKVKITNRYFYYFIFEKENKFYLKKRESRDIWQGLFDFHLIEKNYKNELDELFVDVELMKLIKGSTIGSVSEVIHHQLTHQNLYIRFIRINIFDNSNTFFYENKENFYSLTQMELLPKPIIIANFINKFIL
jgi:A/G-specific adenine glycosylase